MLNLFIVIDKNSKYYIPKISDLYTKVFNGAPFFENWNNDSSKKEFLYAANIKGFYGLAYENNNQINGISWGYSLPKNNSGRVDYEIICNNLKKRNIEIKNTFYLSELAIKDTERNKGIGTLLLKTQKDNIEEKIIAFRTKNPAMKKVGIKSYTEYLFSFPEESSYKGGMIYVFKK